MTTKFLAMQRCWKPLLVLLLMGMAIGAGFAAERLPFPSPQEEGAFPPRPMEPQGAHLDVLGLSVIPHVGAPGVRSRRKALSPLDTRVQVFVGSSGRDDSRAPIPLRMGRIAFNGLEAQDCLDGGYWSWHDTPDLWDEGERTVPFGALTVWTFNSVGDLLGKSLRLEVDDLEQRVLKSADLPIEKPRIWLSSVTFIGNRDSPFPDQLIFYLRNDSDRALEIVDARLFLPESSETRRWLAPRPALGRKIHPFSADSRVESMGLGGARIRTGYLPLTYTALEVKVRSDEGQTLSIWAYLRIKKETFDISGGWIGAEAPQGNPLTQEPYLKTLQRMHVNMGQIQEVPGYTDQDGPEDLYTRYPLKYAGRLWPIEQYDNRETLDRVHAIEFLRDPQRQTKGTPPQEVFEAFLPYSWSRMPTALSLSDSQNWHRYAGLSDYANFSAYRVGAPSADVWGAYQRWGAEEGILWGAPLETVGTMTRSLRETNRPAPIAAWSQGAHVEWEGVGGRTRNSPTPDELRVQAYHALANRVTSLYWFNLSLESLVKHRDLIEPITRIGREIRMFEPFLIKGTAFRHKRIGREGKVDWDLASIVAPMGALLFAMDLDYQADAEEKVFVFGKPRKARFEFALPTWLREPVAVFRVDADGLKDVDFVLTKRGVGFEDEVSKVAVYVATRDPKLREAMERFIDSIIEFEESLKFDPGKNDADFAVLKSLWGEE